MQSVLIIAPDDAFRTELIKELQKHYRLLYCGNATEGIACFRSIQPDVLILNLFLPGIDGLRMLEMLGDRHPTVTITLSAVYTLYDTQQLLELGVNHMLLMPCTIHTVMHHVVRLLKYREDAQRTEVQKSITDHLTCLGFPTHLDGYQMLRMGTPIFAQDPNQSMTKEFYPAVALLCGNGNWKQVERSIRTAIRHAWEHRDADIWQRYFPDVIRCPSSKKFISRMTELLET